MPLIVIFWRGFGCATLGLAVVCPLIGMVATGGGEVGAGAGLLVAALVNLLLFVGTRPAVDPTVTKADACDREVEAMRPKHDLYFISIQWWSIPMALGGLGLLIHGLMS